MNKNIKIEKMAEEKEKQPDKEKKQPSPQALALEVVSKHVDLCHDDESRTYGLIKVDGRRELWPIDSKRFRQWLGQKLYTTHGSILTANNWKDLKANIEGVALYTGRLIEVHVRTAKVGDAYYLDLCRDDWKVVRIDKTGWRVVPSTEGAYFRRTSAMKELPIPKDGDHLQLIEMLGPHMKMKDHDKRLVVAFIIECMRPDTDYPILEITGSPGTAKSTTQRFIRLLTDPNASLLRSAPKNVDDVFVSAGNNHLVSYENLSNIGQAMSDALCVLATGGGHAKRTLYTDMDETVITVKRPVCINGIPDLAKQPDMVDRLIRITLPPIKFALKKDVEDAFFKARPEILGAILDCFVLVLAELPNVEVEDFPRMADFANLCVALTNVFGWKTSLLETYLKKRSDIFKDTLDASPTMTAVMEYIKSSGGSYYGNYKLLFEEITVRNNGSSDNWVTSPKGLASLLKRNTPALKATGYEITFDQEPKNDGYRVNIIFKGN